MHKILLNNDWKFTKLPDSSIALSKTSKQEYQSVNLPHTWYSDEDPYRGLTVYRKSIRTDDKWKNVFLELNGADQSCVILINGEEVGKHRGAYSCFRVQVPENVLKSDRLDIEIYLDNSINQEISPIFGDFTVFGGLYRDVNLLIVEENHFDYKYYGTDGIIVCASMEEGGIGIVKIEPHAVAAENAIICYELYQADGVLTGQIKGRLDENLCMRIDNPHLWDGKKQPYLYTLKAYLYVGDRIYDETEKTIGFRTGKLYADCGFYLNGTSFRLHGISKHQDTANVFCAEKNEEVDRDFDLIDEIGANAVRLSHYQHSQYTYDQCDRKGYVVWAEIPMLKMTESRELLENAQLQLTELILQNIHHPSICFWGIQNEIAMFMDAEFMHRECRALYTTAKTLDPDRIVTAANLYSVKAESELNRITDMVGYNLYFGWYYGQMKDYDAYLDYLHTACPEASFGISEYGVDANPNIHSEEPRVKDYSEEFQALFHETVYPILEGKSYLWGSFVWNMFDFSSPRRNEGGRRFINQKGLVSFDRSIKKDAFYYYKAKWSEQPFLHICSKRFKKRSRAMVSIKIYTNLQKVTLYGREGFMENEQNNGNGVILFTDIILSEGINKLYATGKSDNGTELKDEIILEKVSEPEQSYILPDSESGTTVKNWFLEEASFIREGYFSIEDSAYDMIQNVEAARVLEQYLPEMVRDMRNNVGIPLGFSLLRIMNYEKKKAEGVNIKALNKSLNKIKKKI